MLVVAGVNSALDAKKTRLVSKRNDKHMMLKDLVCYTLAGFMSAFSRKNTVHHWSSIDIFLVDHRGAARLRNGWIEFEEDGGLSSK